LEDETLRKAGEALARAAKLAETARALAAIDSQDPHSGEVEVGEYRKVLASLLRKYRQNPDEISKATLDARKAIAAEGGQESLVSILRSLDRIFPTESDTRDYSLWLSGYATVRSKGHSPDECVEALRELTEEMGHR
jgi:hypothetical protein